MTKNAKRFFSMMLALSMVFSLALPAAATETEEHDHEHAEEVVQETVAAETVEETTAVVETSEDISLSVDTESIKVDMSEIKLDLKLDPAALLTDEEVEVDTSNPIIITLETELKSIKVLDEETGESVKLTEEQIQQLLGMYQQYLDHWAANANVLGVQTPFFLSYNDSGEDGLGIMGEMLVMAGISLEDVRAGKKSYDDLSGMILNFLMGDQLGVQLYGETIKAKRDEVLALVNAGDYTEAQKMLIINDWLAHNATFDMSYIMNADKEEDEMPMVAETPVKHQYYDVVYQAIYDIYEPQIRDTFEQNIVDGLKAQMKQTFYEAAIEKGYHDAVYQNAYDSIYESTYESAYEAAYEDALSEYVDYEAAEQRAWDDAKAEYLKSDDATTLREQTYADAEAEYAETEEGKQAYQDAYNAVVTEYAESEAGQTTYTNAYNDALANYNKESEEAQAIYNEAYQAELTAYPESEAGKALYEETYNQYFVDNPPAEETPSETEEAAAEAAAKAAVDDAAAKAAETAGNNAVEEAAETAADEAGDAAVAAAVESDAVAAGNAAVKEAAEPYATEQADAAVNNAAEDYADTYVAENEEAIKAAAEAEVSDENKAAAEAAAKETAEAQAKTTAEEQATAAAESETEKFMTDNEEAIKADPVAFCESSFGADAAAAIAAEWENFWEDCETNGVPGMVAEIKKSMVDQGLSEEAAEEQMSQMGIDPSEDTNPDGRVALDIIVAMQMDTPQEDPMLQKPDGSYMTPNEAVPVFAEQAATGLTEGVLDYWEGSHIGILGDGTGVCLGYTKTFTYLVQSMHPEVYLVEGATALDSEYVYTYTDENGDEQSVPMPGINWKKPEDLYYNDNDELDINLNYVVDSVRITFDADVKMYGVEQANFNSDHFWNAVQIDGKWYYVDPCYTDVYGEVMMRDRVETDGAMNHLYFLFSDASARELYDGNYFELKSIYVDVEKDADGRDVNVITDNTSSDYEKGWFAYAKSNVYIDGGYAYYLYDTTDMLDLMDQMNTEGGMDNLDIDKLMSGEFKIVKHALGDDADDKQNVVESLIDFNHEETTTETADDGTTTETSRTYARVNDNGEMVESELLTKLYEKHTAEEKIYPGLNLTAALYGGKIYFNLSNCILSYNLSDGSVVIEKKYETIHGSRDKTVPFGGMAFSVVSDGGDFTVYNRPLAGLTIKDGTMYASVATNFAFISGKADRQDVASDGYGYAYEESNYNSNYSSFTASQNADEKNDNDEFMWSANFVDTFSVSSLSGGTTEYDFTECDHHFVRFDEEYYTTDDSGNFNTGYSYVCTECNFAIDEPVKSEYAGQFGMEDNYEEELAIFQAAEANHGHTYVATDGVYNAETGCVDFTHLKCSAICPERYGKVDCLLEDNGEKDYTGSVDAVVAGAEGSCTDGLVTTYTGSTVLNEGTEEEPKNIKVSASVKVQGEPGQHAYEVKVGDSEWSFKMDDVTGEATDERIAKATITCHACEDVKIEDVEATEIVADPEKTYAPTCTEDGANAFIATYILDDGTVVKEYKSFKANKLGHTISEVAAKDATCTETGNTAHFACEVCGALFEDLEGTTAITDTSAVVIPATGHELSLVEEKAATCVSDGNNAYYTCANCEMVFKDAEGTTETTVADETVAALGHSFTSVASDIVYSSATCTEPAYHYIKCDNCGAVSSSEEDIIAVGEPNGHSWDEGVVTKAPTTEETGIRSHECTVCGEKKEEVIPVKAAVLRVSGGTRYETSFAIAEQLKDVLGVKEFDTIIVASGESYPDALSGSYLSTTKNAPILLTNKSMNNTVLTYIQENLSSNGMVYILGGVNSVTQSFEDSLNDAGIENKRLSGATRVETNLAILEEVGVKGDKILISTAYNYADTLSASASGLPILLLDTNANKLTDAQKAFLEEHSDCELYIVGGVNTVSEKLAAEIEAYGAAERISGSTREETSIAVASFIENPECVVLAYSRNYPDGLCGGVLAYNLKAPVILTNVGAEDLAAAYVEENGISEGVILGGVNSVKDESVRTIFSMASDDTIDEVTYTISK